MRGRAEGKNHKVKIDQLSVDIEEIRERTQLSKAEPFIQRNRALVVAAHLKVQLLKAGRQRAQGLIRNGQIFVNGVVCTKPAYGVAEGDQVTMEGEDLPFVGRGGLKLEHAVQAAGLQLDGLVCMDIGASTGGFTDCMLQHGARRVYAVDVGHGQLAESLRQDSRVVNWEGTDIRSVTPAQLPEPVDFFSVDVSFISLTHVLPSAAAFLAHGGKAAILIKPQFEAGRENIGKNGLVTSPRVHQNVLVNTLALLHQLELEVQLLCPSPIRGGTGNAEYLAVAEKHLTKFWNLTFTSSRRLD